ncbi:sigma factor-like helix-turn-helix DNA-binding protein [Streptomyces sp. NPDC001373]|uniref:sigma factor-like helix-turn-helix DNA-binding protein n=1 Tax=Streptomyces sp. NPDC001373 TaxID=3364565 RepID=UPI003690BDE8
MDTTALDAAAQRYRRAEAALDKARAELTAEAVACLRSTDERGAQAEVARRIGWSRERVRQIMAAADAEAMAPVAE